MTKTLPESDYGPNVDFRESSFLQNPKTPPSVISNTLHLSYCEVCPAHRLKSNSASWVDLQHIC